MIRSVEQHYRRYIGQGDMIDLKLSFGSRNTKEWCRGNGGSSEISWKKFVSPNQEHFGRCYRMNLLSVRCPWVIWCNTIRNCLGEGMMVRGKMT